MFEQNKKLVALKEKIESKEKQLRDEFYQMVAEGDDLFKKSYAQEVEQKSTREILFEMNGKLCTIEQDVKHIQKIVDHQKSS
jgi:hypothetical protein